MTEVTAEQKQKAKAAAANAAVASNDLAVVLGAAGAVAAAAGTASGVAAPAGIGVGLVLVLGSFGAWYMGNRYQRLANDPPRTDFQTETVSAATYAENQSNDEPVASLRALSGEQLVFADASSALVLSIERYDGAIAANDTDAAERQAQAVQKNANAGAASLARLQQLAATLNDNWTAQSGSLDWSSASIDDARKLLTDTCGDDVTAPAPALSDLLTRIQGADTATLLQPLSGEQHPLFQAQTLPDKPTALFGDSYLQTMAAAADALSALGTSTANA